MTPELESKPDWKLSFNCKVVQGVVYRSFAGESTGTHDAESSLRLGAAVTNQNRINIQVKAFRS